MRPGDQRAALRGLEVGFVFQSFQLLDSLNAVENVMLPLELAGRRDARQHATELLERVGLKARISHYPQQLSGGEQQRVAIARALICDPPLILADEPTAQLLAQLLEVVGPIGVEGFQRTPCLDWWIGGCDRAQRFLQNCAHAW